MHTWHVSVVSNVHVPTTAGVADTNATSPQQVLQLRIRKSTSPSIRTRVWRAARWRAPWRLEHPMQQQQQQLQVGSWLNA